MSNKNKWKDFCSQQDSCETCKYKGECDCEIEFWKDWARAEAIEEFKNKLISGMKNGCFHTTDELYEYIVDVAAEFERSEE